MKGIQTFRLWWPRHAAPHERGFFSRPARPKAGHTGWSLGGISRSLSAAMAAVRTGL